MRRRTLLRIALVAWGLASLGQAETPKIRLLVVDSYHREYLWSQATQEGLSAAMLQYGYLDNPQQVDELAARDGLESSRTVVRKEWMDTKRKYTPAELAESTARISKVVEEFKPDLILLGDDNAANYIGNQFLEGPIPMIFWGVNGWPLKYGLLDSVEKPGHNVTGVWQSGYYRESLELLHQLVPDAETFAILACNSETARAKVKAIIDLDAKRELPLTLVDVVKTNSYEEFQAQALELAETVDAFFVLNHDTMKDTNGAHVDMLTVGRWYLEHVRKPETSDEAQFVQEGMLCVADDSGYNQAFEAFKVAVDVLEKGRKPGEISARSPGRGPLMVNRHRARTLGLTIPPFAHVDQYVEGALALDEPVRAAP